MAVNERDSVIIDIDHLVSSMEDMMPRDLLMSPNCCIFKTPAILHRHNEKAYIPNAFSIGPLHHGRPKLKAAEKIKAKYLQGLITRSSSPDTMLRTLVGSIMKVEKEARECYAEAIDYNPEQLVQILVIDGCFLIELFRKLYDEELREKGDPIFSRFCMRQFLYHDLILLENQVPWKVLEILFNLTVDSFDENPLILLAIHFLNNNLLQRVPTSWLTPKVQSIIMKFEGIKHFLDLNRTLSTLFSEEKKEIIGKWELLPSATSLVEAGIQFKRGTSRSILDIKFTDGILEIPPLLIQETTETAIRNLISFEQCYPKSEARITSYAKLLGNLINTAKDIDILCHNHVIDNWLSSEDAAQLFNKLYHDTYVDHYYYAYLCRSVNKFCRHRWPRWRAVLVHNYFNTPWSIFSTLAAVILLIFTFLQTLYSMKN